MNPLKILAALLLFVVISACNKDSLEMSEMNKQNLEKTESNDDDGCETAYFKWTPVCLWQGWVFATNKNMIPPKVQSLELSKNKWGWAINIPDGHNLSGKFEIWAAAGKNDTSKGFLVGEGIVKRTADSGLQVTYNVISGYNITEVHIYAKDAKPSTTAPGQFGFTKEFDPGVQTFSEDFTAIDTDGDGVWVIAHAVVCAD